MALALAGHALPLPLARVLVTVPPRQCVQWLEAMFGPDAICAMLRRQGERAH